MTHYVALINFRCNGIKCKKGDVYHGRDIALLLQSGFISEVHTPEVDPDLDKDLDPEILVPKEPKKKKKKG